MLNKILILNVLMFFSLAANAEGLLNDFPKNQIGNARKALTQSSLENNISEADLKVVLNNLKIESTTKTKSERGRIWCDRPTSYKISMPHPLDPAKKFSVKLAHYRPRNWARLKDQEKKTVIITPATGGADDLEKNHAFYMCDWKGLEVIRIASWSGDEGVNAKRGDESEEIRSLINSPESLSFKIHDRGTVLNTAAIWSAIAFADTQNIGLDPTRSLGILGNSVGGMAASVAMARFPRLTTGVLVVPGAPVYEVIATSGERRLSALRKVRMALLGLKSLEGYIQVMKKHVVLDPTLAAKNILTGKKAIFVTAGQDQTVPSINQQDLLEHFSASGASVREIHDAEKDHLKTIVGTLTSPSRMEILGNFFKENL